MSFGVCRFVKKIQIHPRQWRFGLLSHFENYQKHLKLWQPSSPSVDG